MRRYMTWLMIGLLLLVGPGYALGRTASDPATTSEQVVPADIKGHWAQQEIQSAIDMGLMVGTGRNGQGQKIFCPEAAVSRAQLAAVLTRTFNLDYGDKRFIKQPLASDYFRDVDNKAWYADALVMCEINDIFAGYGDRFDPNRSVSRIEVAQAVRRCFEAKKIDVVMIMVMPEYNDMKGLTQEETNALVFVSNTGIMKGDGNNNFRPRGAVKRAELARILNRCTSMMSVDQNYNNKEYTMAVGQSFILSLPGNPSTGYSWMMDIGDKSLLRLDGEGFQPGADTRLIGQGGTNWWKMTALRSGTTKIKLNYQRPWESVQPAQTFEMTVIIK
ncbi:MAG: protease inhibitor I42 family protein [Deltaproteobacteria bacterium]